MEPYTEWELDALGGRIALRRSAISGRRRDEKKVHAEAYSSPRLRRAHGPKTENGMKDTRSMDTMIGGSLRRMAIIECMVIGEVFLPYPAHPHVFWN
jgi:hypothetical protein